MLSLLHYQYPPQCGTSVTAHESTLTYHYHSKSLVYTKVPLVYTKVSYLLCVLTNEWWLVATIIVSCRTVPHPWNPLCSISPSLHPHKPLATTDPFLLSSQFCLFQNVILLVVVVQSLSCVQLFVTPWTATHQASLSFTISQSLLRLMSIQLACYPAISPSIAPFSSCPQSFPASGSFPMSQLFTSGGQNTGASASASALPVNIQGWFPLGWTGWMSLQSQGFSRVLQHHNSSQSWNQMVCSLFRLASFISNNMHLRFLQIFL